MPKLIDTRTGLELPPEPAAPAEEQQEQHRQSLRDVELTKIRTATDRAEKFPAWDADISRLREHEAMVRAGRMAGEAKQSWLEHRSSALGEAVRVALSRQRSRYS